MWRGSVELDLIGVSYFPTGIAIFEGERANATTGCELRGPRVAEGFEVL